MRPSQAPDLAIAPSLRWTAFIPVNAIGAWLGVSFVLGASARTIPTGALGGLVGLVSAVGAYYLFIGILGEGFRAIGASHAAMVWGAVALLAGPLFGLAGGTWRHGHGWPRAISVALLAAALIGEGVYFGPAGIPASMRSSRIPVHSSWRRRSPSGWHCRGSSSDGASAFEATSRRSLWPPSRSPAIGPVVTFIRGIADRF